MAYYFLKIIHIISASLLVGSVLMGFAFTLAYSRISTPQESLLGLTTAARYDCRLSLLALLLQPITGFAIIAIKHYNPMSLWVLGTIAGYVVIGCLWLTMLFQQQRLIYLLDKHEPEDIRPLVRKRGWLLIISLPCWLILYYLMTHQPL